MITKLIGAARSVKKIIPIVSQFNILNRKICCSVRNHYASEVCREVKKFQFQSKLKLCFFRFVLCVKDFQNPDPQNEQSDLDSDLYIKQHGPATLIIRGQEANCLAFRFFPKRSVRVELSEYLVHEDE